MNDGTLATWEKYASNARVIWNIVYVATVFIYLKLILNSYAKTVIQLFLYINYNKPEKKVLLVGCFWVVLWTLQCRITVCITDVICITVLKTDAMCMTICVIDFMGTTVCITDFMCITVGTFTILHSF